MANVTSGLAGRYATALYELADTAGALDAVAADLRDLRKAIEDNEDLSLLVNSPLMAREDKVKAIGAVLAAANAHALTAKFAGTVATNNRLYVLPAMIDAFLAELARRRGEIKAKVISAHNLTEGQTEELAMALNKAMGAKVTVEPTIDPNLLGGLIVKVGSRMIDSSLSTKLQRLQLAMKGVG